MNIETILPQVIDLARNAGLAIMERYRTEGTVYQKQDNSPVTEADRVADRIIVEGLKKITPDFPIVSEEGSKPDVSKSRYFWLVDPLDGTKSFIRGNGYFTVNIALVEGKDNPILGVIYEPVNQLMYYGSIKGAFKEAGGHVTPIRTKLKDAPEVAFVSHSHLNQATQDYLMQHRISVRVPCASSIKFCFLAEGKADVYPRFGPTMEWDIAAGHAILTAAGGKVVTPEGKPFQYGKEGFLNGNFLAIGN
ncbi:MAG TPA: 3'(2'),5'-bisphosphate nucleotidase CysQ [Rickettsiales bacterium]|nr:3'(2'),5'-bisphosphate nucleotidase CysQ [Rickettsiales bacterium]